MPSIVKYTVEQSTAATGPWTAVAGSPFYAFTDTVTGLAQNTNYYFRITAIDEALNLTGPPTVIGPIVTGPAGNESAQGTRLTSTIGTIVDANFGIWRLVQVGTVLHVQHPDGTQDGTNVLTLLYWNSTIYKDDNGFWSFWNGSSWISVSGDPSISSNDSAQGTQVTDTTGTITDSLGGNWRLAVQGGSGSGVGTYATPGRGTISFSGHTFSIASNGDMMDGSNAIFGGSETSAIDLYNNTLYAQDAVSGTWYTYDLSTQQFTQSSAPGNLPGTGPTVYQVVHNSVLDDTTRNVVLLLYWNHTVYHENASGNWYYWNSTQWLQTTDPRTQVESESPNNTVVNSTIGVIVDGTGNRWTITSGQQIAENGQTLSNTSAIILLLYYNHIVYQEANNPNELGVSPGWWYWNGNGWVAANGDPRGQAIVFSSLDKSSGIVLSGNNLTATNVGSNGNQSVRSTIGYSGGKRYFEATITSLGFDWGIGVANSSFPLGFANQLGGSGDSNGIGYYPCNPTTPQSIKRGSTATNTQVSVGTARDVVGAVLSVAMDFDAKLAWFSSPAMRTQASNTDTWNNVVAADPAQGTGGISFSTLNAGPYYACWNDNDVATVVATVFDDEFYTFGPHRTWQTGDNWGFCATISSDGRGGPNFNEFGQQFWVNPLNPNTPIKNLYSAGNGLLQLGVANTPSTYASYINAQAGATMPYVATLLNNQNSAYRLFGYYEYRVAVPKIPGFCFQVDLEDYPATTSWNLEIDMSIGTNGSGAQSFILQFQWASPNFASQIVYTNTTLDFTQSHTYGLNWQTDNITLYIDGTQVYQTATTTYGSGIFRTNSMFCYMLTAANYQQANVNPSAASLPAYATVDYFRIYATKPTTTGLVAAYRIADMLEIFGANTFPDGQDGSNSTGTNTAASYITAFDYLTASSGMGLTNRLYDNGTDQTAVARSVSASRPNIRWGYCYSQGSTATTVEIGADALRTAGVLAFVEGANEPNLSTASGGTALTSGTCLTIQQALFGHYTNVPVAEASVADTGTNTYPADYWGSNLPAAVAASTYYNGHDYPNSFAPSRDMYRRTLLFRDAGWPGIGIISEFHPTLYQNPGNPTDETTGAYYLACALPAAFRYYGAKALIFFELYDYAAVGSTGLFNGTDPSSPRMAAKVIRNFFHLCSDASATRHTFTPPMRAISVVGLPAVWNSSMGGIPSGGGQWLYAAGTDGREYVFVWNEQNILNLSGTSTVTVNLGGTAAVEDFSLTNPITDTPTAIQTLSNVSSVTMQLTTEVRVLRLTYVASPTGNASCTVNFGAGSFVRALPNAFSAWGSSGQQPVPNAPVFDDEFTSLSLYNIYTSNPTGTWQPAMWWSGPDTGTTDADAWALNPFNPNTPVSGVYSVSNGVLQLGVVPTPNQYITACGGKAYCCGFLQSFKSFDRQLYGYFEVTCAMPRLPGIGGNFWLISDQTGPPPELDVMEWLCPASSPGSFFGKFSMHSGSSNDVVSSWYTDSNQGPPLNGTSYQNGFSGDMAQMNQYGVDWQSDFTTLYINRVQMFRCVTPADCKVPMGIILSIGTGGDWVGSIQSPPSLPVYWQIDSVKVWNTKPF